MLNELQYTDILLQNGALKCDLCCYATYMHLYFIYRTQLKCKSGPLI